MQTQIEELSQNRVRMQVEVPREDVAHAIDHAASDLATSLRIPGFRKGKVPLPVLVARVGRERLYAEAVESHIGGWFWNAASRSRIRPVASPQYEYEPPASSDHSFRFTATVDVQPKAEVADWATLEVPAAEAEVPSELVDQEVEALRHSVAELAPVDGRAAAPDDTVVIDLESADGDVQRDYVAELGADRLLPDIDAGLQGMRVGETKSIEYEVAEDDRRSVTATVKEIKEKVLPPLDDELARAASEFETLGELRADIEGRLREQLEEEVEAEFRSAVADRLVEASRVDASGPLVDARTLELARGLERSLAQRGVSLDVYLQLTNTTAEELRERLAAQARQSVARELVLEAVADQLDLQVPDDQVDELVRAQAEETGDSADDALTQLRDGGGYERLRDDLRLRAALDRVASEVKRIPVDLARAREKLWTPGQEKSPADTKLWTPSSTKEPA